MTANSKRRREKHIFFLNLPLGSHLINKNHTDSWNKLILHENLMNIRHLIIAKQDVKQPDLSTKHNSAIVTCTMTLLRILLYLEYEWFLANVFNEIRLEKYSQWNLTSTWSNNVIIQQPIPISRALAPVDAILGKKAPKKQNVNIKALKFRGHWGAKKQQTFFSSAIPSRKCERWFTGICFEI